MTPVLVGRPKASQHPTFFFSLMCFFPCYSLQYSTFFFLSFLSKQNPWFLHFCNSLFEDKGSVVVLIFLAFSEAFDTMPYGKLLTKPCKLGISIRTVKWVKQWLKGTGRGLCWKGVWGCRQVTRWGPLLGIIFINIIFSLMIWVAKTDIT